MLERQWRQQCAELDQPDHAATLPAAAPARRRYNLSCPAPPAPTCKAPITALQNIPVSATCFCAAAARSCGAHISVRYPIVEALTGILSAAVAWKFGFGWPAAAGLVLTWFLVALAFIDIDHPAAARQPDAAAAVAGPAPQPLRARPALGTLPVDVRSSIIGAIAGYLSLWSVYHLFRLLTAKEGMGYGDFKLLAALGAWLGWRMLLPTVLIAAAVGAVAGIALLAARGQNRSTPIAFGPFLAAAGWLMLMFGQELVTGYLGLFGSR